MSQRLRGRRNVIAEKKKKTAHSLQYIPHHFRSKSTWIDSDIMDVESIYRIASDFDLDRTKTNTRLLSQQKIGSIL